MSKLANELLHLKDLFINKKFNKIKELSKSLLIKYPESFEINLIIGTSYLANKKPNIALPLLIKANKINPASSICLLNISICYKQLKILPITHYHFKTETCLRPHTNKHAPPP